MTKHTVRHPAQLTSLVVLRSRGPFDPRGSIRSAAAFHVERTREGPRFSADHRAYEAGGEQGDIIGDILSMVPADHAVLMRVPKVTKHQLRKILAKGTAPRADVQVIPQMRPGLSMIPIEVTERTLDGIADGWAIPRADRDAPLIERARRATDEAQVLWLAYLWSICGRRDRLSLTSAWEAWTALQRARPLPF